MVPFSWTQFDYISQPPLKLAAALDGVPVHGCEGKGRHHFQAQQSLRPLTSLGPVLCLYTQKINFCDRVYTLQQHPHPDMCLLLIWFLSSERSSAEVTLMFLFFIFTYL